MKTFLVLFIAAALLFSIGGRLLSHAPNFTPMGAFALFAGAYLAQKSRWLLLLPLGAMAVSDLFIGLYDWKLMAVVYASFLVYGILGMIVGKQKRPEKIFLAAVTGSLVFYLVTNAAVWIFSPWYPHNLQGLLLSYTLALPFFKMTLLGDVFYAAVFFGGYEAAVFIGNIIARKRSISLRT
ncbi:MAG: hypothetical protein HYV55_01825 [Parcubacteria group bacterium]|nr:hypothetical protein [Parcubacteria group bacterium]